MITAMPLAKAVAELQGEEPLLGNLLLNSDGG